MPLDVAEGDARLDLRTQIESRGRGTGQIDKVIFPAHGINAREHKAAAEKTDMLAVFSACTTPQR